MCFERISSYTVIPIKALTKHILPPIRHHGAVKKLIIIGNHTEAHKCWRWVVVAVIDRRESVPFHSHCPSLSLIVPSAACSIGLISDFCRTLVQLRILHHKCTRRTRPYGPGRLVIKVLAYFQKAVGSNTGSTKRPLLGLWARPLTLSCIKLSKKHIFM